MIKTYQQAIAFINQFTQSDQKKYSDRVGLTRQRYILDLLGNPQDQTKTIHIAGTSGKGSTSFYLSSLLISHGFNVGLTLSPHLLDVRERMLINNQLISQAEFVHYLNQIIPAIRQAELKKYGQPGYFELLLLLSFYIFSQKKVDYVVLETGIGGLLDSSNTISRSDKVCLFTKFGLDHTSILGSNIKSIANQKAGIVHQFNPMFSVDQLQVAKDILTKTAQDNQTSINFIIPQKTFTHIKPNHNFLTYDFNSNYKSFKTLSLNTIGLFQVENSSIALTVFLFLSRRDNFKFNELIIRDTLFNTKFYGRMDFNLINGQPIILDGAHNPQKFRSMVKSLKLFFPQQKFTIIIAYKKRADFFKMIKLIIPVANSIIVTSLVQKDRDSQSYLGNRKSLTKIFQDNPQVNFQVIPNYNSAFQLATKSNYPILITGSLYLVGNLYPLVVKKNNLS